MASPQRVDAARPNPACAGGLLLDAHVDLARIVQAAGVGILLAGVLLLAIRPSPEPEALVVR